MYDDETSQFGATISTLSMAVGLILIIACVNVAGLLLARGATRARASWRSARRSAPDEDGWSGSCSPRACCWRWPARSPACCSPMSSLDSLVALIPLSLPANSPVAINATVLAFALGLTVVTALLFGLVPALKLSRAPKMISTMLAVGGRSGAPLSKRAGQWLIGIEVALALVLMTGAGLILRSFAKLVSVDLGFDAANVLTLEVEPLDQSAVVRRDYYAALADALRRLPEVVSAGAIDQLALTGGGRFGFTKTDTGADFDGPRCGRCCPAISRRWASGRLRAGSSRTPIARPPMPSSSTPSASQQYFDGNAVGHTLRVGMKDPAPPAHRRRRARHPARRSACAGCSRRCTCCPNPKGPRRRDP